jgi:murein L,D-transpeptidase YafK
MRLRRFALGLIILMAAGVLLVLAWDFLQLGRRVPETAPASARATLIVVEKSARRMTLLHDDIVLKAYDVALGSAPRGHKEQEGDGRTPEGSYSIDFKNARSRFHLALRISYPSREDRARALRRGVSPGSDIMIHGMPNGLGWLDAIPLRQDWTDGCIAVTNRQIEEIWPLVAVGTTVEIRP